ncbi:MAG: hypothetical protein EOM23_08530 [Candidatus Moranbacteria bacterium]|nr:hypothetical protein [Candidatus Moranbacteria bacterium]
MTLEKNTTMEKSKPRNDFWSDSMVHNFYIDYYQNLSSKELDREFNNDIKSLTHVLSQLSVSERKAFIEVLSRFIEFYLETKIEKEIDNSFYKILKF